MGIKTFKGGVHPNDSKISANKEIEKLPMPSILTVLLSQHIGAPSKPLVKRGSEVKKGEVIAESNGFVSVPQHSPTSGVVKKIVDVFTVMGTKTKAIQIEADGNDEWAEGLNTETDYSNLSPQELVEKIKNSGIVGLGGATFPTHVKLSPDPKYKIEYLIINGAECEPYLTCDYRLMLERSEDLLEGIDILRKILNPKKVFIGIENNKGEAIKKLQNLTQRNNSVEVVPLKVKYPQGDEKQLIKAITGREAPAGGLPMHVGVVVQNVGTVVAVLDAVKYNKPLIERVVTVSGKAINDPKNILAPIGASISELIDFAGGYKEPPAKLINGGPMMGFAIYSSNFPVTKGTSGILALSFDETDISDETVCINCGKCVDVCPQRLVPSLMATYIEYKKWDKVQLLNLMECKECGTCGYVCPAKRNLIHLFKYGKQELKKLNAKK